MESNIELGSGMDVVLRRRGRLEKADKDDLRQLVVLLGVLTVSSGENHRFSIFLPVSDQFSNKWLGLWKIDLAHAIRTTSGEGLRPLRLSRTGELPHKPASTWCSQGESIKLRLVRGICHCSQDERWEVVGAPSSPTVVCYVPEIRRSWPHSSLQNASASRRN